MLLVTKFFGEVLSPKMNIIMDYLLDTYKIIITVCVFTSTQCSRNLVMNKKLCTFFNGAKIRVMAFASKEF